MASKLLTEGIKSRVRRPSLFSKLTNINDVIESGFFKDGMRIGWSGFTGVGYPKITPNALADYVEKNNLQGKLKFDLYVGASTSAEVEDRWAKNGMIARRYPYQLGKILRSEINKNHIKFADKHLSEFPLDLVSGYYTLEKKGNVMEKLDVAVVEATAITERGNIIPGASIGATPEIVQTASKIIIEVNTALP
ncbi:23423_t:CDS:2, partial [Gigaspora rosea]